MSNEQTKALDFGTVPREIREAVADLKGKR